MRFVNDHDPLPLLDQLSAALRRGGRDRLPPARAGQHRHRLRQEAVGADHQIPGLLRCSSRLVVTIRWPNSSARRKAGCIEYRYADAVRLAGHSCPTVAAAYWMTRKALAALYPDCPLPQRGAIRADFRADRLSGVTGVIASVVTLLTGATHDTGFKGLAGQFDRRKLMYFLADIGDEIRFTRLDTGAAVDVRAELQNDSLRAADAGSDAEMPGRQRQRRRDGRFKANWQARVRALLLEHGDDPEVFVLRAGGAQADAGLSGCASGALPCTPSAGR
jgi:hypothetical protein